MSTTLTLPSPTDIIERLVRSNEPIIIDNIDGYEIAAVRNGYANGFGVVVLAADLQGLGTQARYAIAGVTKKPSARYFAELVRNATAYIARNRTTLFPYVAPEPADICEDDTELLLYLQRESRPVNWQTLSVDRLRTNPRYIACGGSLERLQAYGAIKLWDIASDGRRVGITAAGRLFTRPSTAR